MDTVLEAHGLTKIFQNVTAVENLTIEVNRGEVVGFLGPNGAGKTTAVRMLCGIIAPTRGYAIVAGIRPEKEVERLHEVIGLLTETPGFYERLSAKRNLLFFGRFYKHIDAEVKTEYYLKSMGLWERRNDRVGSFSKGMKQRLALARALLHEPQVLFLDEPTAGLDPETALDVRSLVKSLRDEGRTIILCTHNLEEAELLCHRIALIKTQLLEMDTPENLRMRLFPRQLVVEMEVISRNVIETVNDLVFVQKVQQDGSHLLVEMDDIDRWRSTVIESIVQTGGKIISVQEKKHSLEEVYLKLLHEKNNSVGA